MRLPRPAGWLAGLLVVAALVVGLRLWPRPAADFGTDSDEARLAFLEGESHLLRYEWLPARESFERAVQADDSFALAHLHLARVLRLLGARPEAERHLALASTWSDSTATEEEALRIAYEVAAVRRDDAARADAFERLVRDYPDRVSTLVLRAAHAKQAQDYEAAWALFERTLEIDPSRVDLHNELGYVALELGRYEDAVTCLQRYAYYVPDAANPHDSLGEAYLHTGRYDESWTEYLRALDVDPGFVSSVIGANEALRGTGRLRAAAKLLDTAEPLFHERGLAHLFTLKRVQLLYAEHRWSDAIEVATAELRDGVFLSANDRVQEVWLRAYRGLAHARSGDVEAARTQIESCKELLDHLRAEYTAPGSAEREDVDLLRSSLEATLAVYAGDESAARLAELRAMLDRSRRQPHRLLPFRTALAEALFLDGLYEETVEVARANLAFNPRHPRSNLIACKAALQLRQREAALPYLEAYLETMRLADEDHPEVAEAQRILQKLAPSS